MASVQTVAEFVANGGTIRKIARGVSVCRACRAETESFRLLFTKRGLMCAACVGAWRAARKARRAERAAAKAAAEATAEAAAEAAVARAEAIGAETETEAA